MYCVVVYDSVGVKIVLMSFASLRDAFAYARFWRKGHREYSDADVFIEVHGGRGAVLVGDIGAVAAQLTR